MRGDLVGYGPFPDRVVSFVQERQILSVRGNHDRWALERGPGGRDEFGGGTPGATTLEYLGQLPFDLELADQAKIGVIVHGSPSSDMEFITRQSHPCDVLRGLLIKLQSNFLVVGHTHKPMWFRCAEGLVVNPGSVVSATRVDSSRTFALLDIDSLDVTFHNVEDGAPHDVKPWT